MGIVMRNRRALQQVLKASGGGEKMVKVYRGVKTVPNLNTRILKGGGKFDSFNPAKPDIPLPSGTIWATRDPKRALGFSIEGVGHDMNMYAKGAKGGLLEFTLPKSYMQKFGKSGGWFGPERGKKFDDAFYFTKGLPTKYLTNIHVTNPSMIKSAEHKYAKLYPWYKKDKKLKDKVRRETILQYG